MHALPSRYSFLPGVGICLLFNLHENWRAYVKELKYSCEILEMFTKHTFSIISSIVYGLVKKESISLLMRGITVKTLGKRGMFADNYIWKTLEKRWCSCAAAPTIKSKLFQSSGLACGKKSVFGPVTFRLISPYPPSSCLKLPLSVLFSSEGSA